MVGCYKICFQLEDSPSGWTPKSIRGPSFKRTMYILLVWGFNLFYDNNVVVRKKISRNLKDPFWKYCVARQAAIKDQGQYTPVSVEWAENFLKTIQWCPMSLELKGCCYFSIEILYALWWASQQIKGKIISTFLPAVIQHRSPRWTCIACGPATEKFGPAGAADCRVCGLQCGYVA